MCFLCVAVAVVAVAVAVVAVVAVYVFVFFPLLQKRSVCDAMQKRSVECTAGNTCPRQGLRMSAPGAANGSLSEMSLVK